MDGDTFLADSLSSYGALGRALGRSRQVGSAVVALLTALVLLSPESSRGERRMYAIPGDIGWEEAQQPPLYFVDRNPTNGEVDPGEYLQVFDFERIPGAIVPIDPVEIVAVPDIPVDIPAETLAKYFAEKYVSGTEWEAIPDTLRYLFTASRKQRVFDFSRRIAKEEVLARKSATLSDGKVVQDGDVMLFRLDDLPGRPESASSMAALQDLVRAGVERIPTMVNIAENRPRKDIADKFNKEVNVSYPTIFEGSLTVDAQEAGFERAFDGDPFTSFERVDTAERDVKQPIMFFVELGRYWPVGLLRLYPRPGTGLLISSYEIRRGLPGTEREIPGLNLAAAGNPGFPVYSKIADTLPTFVLEASDTANRKDTVSVDFTPPVTLRYFRVDVNTELDYDLAEVEAYADGFLPEATFLSRVLPLEPSVFGRVLWDEDPIGAENRSKVTVSFRTGGNSEPLVFFRRTEDLRIVEWMSDEQYADAGLGDKVLVVDRRRGSSTFGDSVALNDPVLRLDARSIYSALTRQERLAIRQTRKQYQALDAKRQDRVEADTDYWSPFQPAGNGQVINAPAGQPYFQFRAVLESSDPRAARVLNSLRFEYYTDPAAQSATGEIAPAANVDAGIPTSFVMALRVALGQGNTGFNRIRVATPARVPGVESLSLDTGDGVRRLERIPVDDPRMPAADAFKELAIEDRYFVVGFPDVRPSDADTTSVLVKLKFESRVLGFRNDFAADVFMMPDSLTALPDQAVVYERRRALVFPLEGGAAGDSVVVPYVGVQSGNVADLAETEQLEDRDRLQVAADVSGLKKGMIGRMKLSSPVITPNGDAVNDQLTITFDVLRLIQARPVVVTVHELTGKRVRLIQDPERTTGAYTTTWDARGDDGQMVPPGMYVLRVRAEADAEDSAVVRVISVAY